MFRITALALGILALFYSINVKLGGKAKEVSNVEEELVPKKKLKKRSPASVKKVAQAPKKILLLISLKAFLMMNLLAEMRHR